ncbi:MAG TPA: carbohydrate ABC transporter permease [Candidatus Eisenbergiella merdipullorum]|uniref:Carbohydrate ABC transporter permease n=1 Tax=Candidatus Eisenbergiella merdipullorum TaxID=2838553 RepID=A0A9D2I9N7_9FIRM|nr:carbohydrate ABC transporter permease [Candidatus Eisenbergiella merdipullorum]
MKTKRIIFNGISYVFLLFIVLLALFPIIYTFFGSFKSNMELLAHPESFFPIEWTFDNYKTAFFSDSFPVPLLLKNSVIFTGFSVVVTLVSSLNNAYVFERGNFPGKTILFTIFASLMFINMGSVTQYAAFNILGALNIPISLYGLMFTRIFGIPIMYTFILRGYIASLPKELDESARIDGCGFMGIFVRVILPLLKPVVSTVLVLTFNSAWNEYLSPTIYTMGVPEQRTLMVGIMALKNSGEGASSWNLMLAGSVVALCPVIFLFLIANRYFIDSITAGAVKG